MHAAQLCLFSRGAGELGCFHSSPASPCIRVSDGWRRRGSVGASARLRVAAEVSGGRRRTVVWVLGCHRSAALTEGRMDRASDE